MDPNTPLPHVSTPPTFTREWLETELKNLMEVYMSGALTVKYADKTVEYDNEAGLKRRIAWIKSQLCPNSVNSTGRKTTVADYDKGVYNYKCWSRW